MNPSTIKRKLAANEPVRPKKNILFLMTDQHRADHVGWHPAARVKTPNLDRLAEGIVFTNCQSVNPVCTPMRTSLITGRYTRQIGTLEMAGDLSLKHPTFMQSLQQAGYHTSGIGKFHYLQTWPWNTPPGRHLDLTALRPEIKKFGFDEIWETAGKQLMLRSYCDYAEHLDKRGLLDTYVRFVQTTGPNCYSALDPDRPGADTDHGHPFPLDEHDHVDAMTADHIIERILGRPKDQPFYIFGSFCSPHKPFDPPAEWLDRVPYEEVDDFIPGETALEPAAKKQLWRKRRAYKAMILFIDYQVGRILRVLEDEGLLDETVIVFTSDHGEMLGDHGRLQKSVYFKESVNVPLVVRHPQYLTGGRNSSPVETCDLAATLLEIAGLDPAASLSRDWPGFQNRIPSRSLLPICKGESSGVRDMAYSECDGKWEMCFDGRFKYVRLIDAEQPGQSRSLLYDLHADPEESSDVSSLEEHRDRIMRHREYLEFIKDRYQPAQTCWAELSPVGEEEN